MKIYGSTILLITIFLFMNLQCNDDQDTDSEVTPTPTSTPSATESFTKILSGDPVNDGGISAGVSWIDYNDDGQLDLFVTNAQYDQDFLYRNEGAGQFTKIATGELTSEALPSSGNSWSDYDNDGDLDLFVSYQDDVDNALFQNDGAGNFVKITAEDPCDDGGGSHHCTWGDYDNDGHLDLFVTNIRKIFESDNDQLDFLYHNNGDRTFTRITEGVIATKLKATLGANWADYDNDGDLDLFVATWNNEKNILYRNNGQGTFSEITAGDIVTENHDSIGCSWGDYDNDGDLDLFVANWCEDNSLYRNEGNGAFTEITTGDIVHDGGESWAGIWGDYDNDGDLDLFVSNYNQNNFLYANNGDTTFTKINQGIVVNDGGLSSGASWGDYDNDGDLDLFIANWADTDNFLYRNLGNDYSWLSVRCIGTVSNRSVIGAKVRVKAELHGTSIWQMREISANTAIRSQAHLSAHFGLADATLIETITVEWPSGLVATLENVNPNQLVTITESSEHSKTQKYK